MMEMPDRENVIECLEIVKRRVGRLNGFGEEAEVIGEAINLLKAQDNTVCTKERCPVNADSISDDCNVRTCPWRTEAVVPRLAKNRLWFECPVCGRRLVSYKDHYCSGCGKRVKWDDI